MLVYMRVLFAKMLYCRISLYSIDILWVHAIRLGKYRWDMRHKEDVKKRRWRHKNSGRFECWIRILFGNESCYVWNFFSPVISLRSAWYMLRKTSTQHNINVFMSPSWRPFASILMAHWSLPHICFFVCEFSRIYNRNNWVTVYRSKWHKFKILCAPSAHRKPK